jgi:hypothetical protein
VFAFNPTALRVSSVRAVYTSQDTSLVGYYKSILDDAGIASFIRNENSNNPEMAGANFFPSLCIIEDSDFDEAIRILKARQSEEVIRTEEWTCPSCKEINPPNFELCWNCNSLRPEA